MFSVSRPTDLAIERFIDASRSLAVSYAPVGMVMGHPDGFQLDELTRVIGRGPRDFDRACAALARWTHFTLGWLEVFPRNAPIAPGTNVAVLIRHLGFWSLNGCRVVYALDALDGQRRFGFAYGTLPTHAERGEELFEVSEDPASGLVSYRIRAASRPRAALARLGYPVARALQARCRRESADRMARAVRA